MTKKTDHSDTVYAPLEQVLFVEEYEEVIGIATRNLWVQGATRRQGLTSINISKRNIPALIKQLQAINLALGAEKK